MLKAAFLPIAAASLALGGCASNRAGEGALVGGLGGAVIGAATGSVVTGAVVGAAAGAAVGSLIKKDNRCYRRYRDGREIEVRCD